LVLVSSSTVVIDAVLIHMEPDPETRSRVLKSSVPTSYDTRDYVEPEASGLLEYWQLIRRRKGKLSLIASSALMASVFVTLQQTPVYQARTSLEIQDINPDFMNIRQVNPIAEGSGTTASNDIQTQIKILQSESLRKRVVRKLTTELSLNVNTGTEQHAARGRAFSIKSTSTADARQAVLNIGATDVKVRLAGQTRIVELLVDSIDPRVAAAFANTLAAEYIEENIEARWHLAQRTGEGLRRQLEDIRIQLEHSEDALQRYSRQAGLVITAENDNLSEQKLRQLQTELVTAQDELIAKQSRFDMARITQPEALPDVLNDISLRTYQDTLTDLRRQKAQLSTLYTPEHAKLRQIQAQIMAVENALDRERSAILMRIRNEYQEAFSRQKLLASAYSKQSQAVTQEAQSRIEYNMLKREVESNHQLYEAMLQRVKEAGVAAALKASQVRVVDPAEVPDAQYKPKPLLNSLLGLSTGLVVGTALLVMRGRSDRRLQSPGDIEVYLEVPELGVIPAITQESPKWLSSRGFRKAITVGKRSLQPSSVAESFRSLLISILFASQNRVWPKVLVLTSASSGEGKTTVTCNLGIALAELGQKVLLVDGDIRRPRLNKIFNISNERGLSTLLQEKDLNGPSTPYQPADVTGLFVLPAGPPISGTTSLLYSSALVENSSAIVKLLQRFRAEFQFVLIDTPPFLYTSDARILCRVADALLFIARAEYTTRDAAQAAYKRLAEDGAPVLGAVLNGWNPKTATDGSYKKYEKYYKQNEALGSNRA
jgi:polysaccharide biosynthesis transport protein